jgi:3-isopropylmalate dehydratase small subunit
MEKFTQLTGIAAPMPMPNIDTDKIFPAVYLKTIKRTGLPGRRIGKSGFRAEPGAVPAGQDPRRRRQFRLRVEP